MFKEKSYTGVKTGYASTNVNIPFYTYSGIQVNPFLTNLFGTILETFLKNECGISDCKYDDTTKVINIKGIDVFLRCYPYNASTVNRCYVDMYIPYITTVLGGAPTATGTVYRQSFLYDASTGNYTITFRFLGEPTAFFYLFVKSYISNTKPSSGSTTVNATIVNQFPSQYIVWGRGNDLVRKKSFISIGFNYTAGMYIFEFGDDGNPIDMLRSKTVINPERSFDALSGENSEFVNSLPLIPVEYGGWYVWEGIYKYIRNIGLPSSSAAVTNDSQLFVTINGETYLFLNNIYGIVKVIN